MLHGQKSKLSARKKCHQARSEAQAGGGAQKTTEEAKKPFAASHSQPGAESSSTPKAPQKATPSASTNLIISSSESDDSSFEKRDVFEAKECPVEAKPCTITLHHEAKPCTVTLHHEAKPCTVTLHHEAKPCTFTLHRDLIARKAIVLVDCLLHNYSLKQLTTKDEMLTLITKKCENDFPEIFRKASPKLEDSFAVEVRKVNSSEQQPHQQAEASQRWEDSSWQKFTQDWFPGVGPRYHPQ
ncbi:hypothetical protein STEG23_022564 [Scotinomys teguina]